MKYILKIIALLFIIIYPFVIPDWLEIIDPCSCTPGYEISNLGCVLSILYPFLIAAVIYFCQTRTFTLRCYFKIFGAVILWGIIFFCFFLFWLFVDYSLIDVIRNNGYFNIFLQYSECEEIEIKPWLIYSQMGLNLLFLIALTMKVKFARKCFTVNKRD